jgi:transcription-repair coupling factor (superfamily II helicase)
MRLRPALKRLLVVSLKASDNIVALRLDERSTVPADLLLAMATKQPKRYRLRPEGVLMMTTAPGGWDNRVDEIEKLLDRLEKGDHGGTTDDRIKQQPSAARTFRRAVR